MELTFHPPGTLAAATCREGVKFLRRRFAQEWGLTRTDIDAGLLAKRENLLLREERKLIGWLGIEASLELANACVESGYPGSVLMGRLLRAAFRHHPHGPLFVYVPTERLASATICIRCGLFLQPDRPPHFKILHYPERSIRLVRLDRCRWPGDGAASTFVVRQELARLREAIGEGTCRGNDPQPLP
ncbi:MAG: hypothetical protein VKI81_05830 [Synechococcaceae cyanobacterium]|nr:hypothetical protein [Synechococcaceae cyanobacterium]